MRAQQWEKKRKAFEATTIKAAKAAEEALLDTYGPLRESLKASLLAFSQHKPTFYAPLSREATHEKLGDKRRRALLGGLCNVVLTLPGETIEEGTHEGLPRLYRKKGFCV